MGLILLKNMEAMIEQLQFEKNQLNQQQATNNELMAALVTQRKKRYLPRNNDSVSNRVRNAQSGGCCSAFWAKKDNNSNNMDPLSTMHLNITNSIQSNTSSNISTNSYKIDGPSTTGI